MEDVLNETGSAGVTVDTFCKEYSLDRGRTKFGLILNNRTKHVVNQVIVS
jgi:hypothetical protein